MRCLTNERKWEAPTRFRPHVLLDFSMAAVKWASAACLCTVFYCVSAQQVVRAATYLASTGKQGNQNQMWCVNIVQCMFCGSIVDPDYYAPSKYAWSFT